MQLGDEARHFSLEGFAVVRDFLGADVAPGREHVAVRGDLGGGGGFAEAGHIGILTRRRGDAEGFRPGSFFSAFSATPRESISSPRMVGLHNLREVGVGQFSMDAVNEGAHAAGVDQEGFSGASALLGRHGRFHGRSGLRL